MTLFDGLKDAYEICRLLILFFPVIYKILHGQPISVKKEAMEKSLKAAKDHCDSL